MKRNRISRNNILFLFAITITYLLSNPIHAAEKNFISRFSFSVGSTIKWRTHARMYNELGQPDWLFENKSAKFISIGYCYYHILDWEADLMLMTSAEKYKADFQYWDRTTVGTLDATLIRINPFVLSREIFDNITGTLNIAGLLLWFGNIDLLENYAIYYPDDDYSYLVDKIELKDKISVTALEAGIFYEIPKIKVNIGIETCCIDYTAPSVRFITSGGNFNEKTISTYGILPLKLRILYNF